MRKLETVETRKRAGQAAAFVKRKKSSEQKDAKLNRRHQQLCTLKEVQSSVVEDRDHLRTQLSAKEAECAKLLAQVKQQAASLSEGEEIIGAKGREAEPACWEAL